MRSSSPSVSRSRRPTGKTRGPSAGRKARMSLRPCGRRHRGHDARRLVQRVVPHVGVEVHRDAVDLDASSLGVDLVAERGDPPVDGDATLDDQLLAGATGAEAGAGEGPLEALLGHAQRHRLRAARSVDRLVGLDLAAVRPRRSADAVGRRPRRLGGLGSEQRRERREGSERRAARAARGTSGVVAYSSGRPGRLVPARLLDQAPVRRARAGPRRSSRRGSPLT